MSKSEKRVRGRQAPSQDRIVEEPSSAVIIKAIQGEYGDDAKRIAEFGAGWVAMMIRKNTNYGSAAWKRPILAPHLTSRESNMCRMSEKIERISQLTSGSADLVGESLDDTIADLGAMCLLYLTNPEGDDDAA